MKRRCILFRTLPIRSDIRATATASLANKPLFKIRQPHIIRPRVAADCDRMADASGFSL
jgi:hypothetical protein